MIKVLVSVVIYLMLAGCSSPAMKTHFYTLSKQVTESNLIKNTKQSRLIFIDTIDLADYLRQKGIVVKESENRLQVSTNHRWAEGLDSALARSLRSNLEAKTTNSRIELTNRYWSGQPFLTIKLEITQFEIDNNSRQTLHTGRYWIHNEKGVLIAQRRFSFAEGLRINGFEHAVGQLQLSVNQLSDMLANDIQAITIL